MSAETVMTTAEGLRAARARYAANPSHVAPDGIVPFNSHCPITAMTDVELMCGAVYSAMRHAFSAVIGPTPIPTWNAEHTTEEVLAAFDRAIAEAA